MTLLLRRQAKRLAPAYMPSSVAGLLLSGVILICLSGRRAFVNNRCFFCFALLLVWAPAGVIAQEKSSPKPPQDQAASLERSNKNCREWKHEACTVCSIDSTTDISLKNKTKTPILLCSDMRPGPAKLVLLAHTEPAIPGVWELEFGLGYQTSARDECPHQFIASNNPPLKDAYEIGPIIIESEIPPDGTIHAMACVGLSSARVGREGKETGALLKAFELRVVSE